MDPEVHLSHSAAETFALGEATARRLGARGVVWLIGPLGAGKTVFAKGFFAGYGIPPERVTSPTFTLINRYREDPPLHHADLYRLGDAREIDDLGLDDALEAPGVAVVEWGERLAGVTPPPAVEVTIGVEADDTRRIELRWRQSEPAPDQQR